MPALSIITPSLETTQMAVAVERVNYIVTQWAMPQRGGQQIQLGTTM